MTKKDILKDHQTKLVLDESRSENRRLTSYLRQVQEELSEAQVSLFALNSPCWP